MKVNRIDGVHLKGMFRSGASWLYQQKDAVDALNVFPVPDGDTGSNMYMTFAAAVREADKILGTSVSDVAQAAAQGALMGARGNSGVILSQFFRGLAKGLDGLSEATAVDVARACNEAASTAVKAVMRPVEGTILTVGREAGRAGMAAAKTSDDILVVLREVVDEGNRTLARTPEMLPALRDAGVVDAGGKGLMVALEGALQHLEAPGMEHQVPPLAAPQASAPAAVRTGITEAHSIEFRYCTEFLIKGEGLDPDRIRQELDTRGDSLLVAGTPSVTKVHIHTNHPGQILEYAVQMGQLSEVHINNMEEQNLEAAALAESRSRKPLGVVAVAVGEGISELFLSLGADAVVEGGQTMNPSIEELKHAVEAAAADHVMILPNNSNVVLTAQQVGQLTDVGVTVVPTKTIPQGIAAMLAYSPESDALASLGEAMAVAGSAVRTGEVTFAVRSSRAGGLEIHEGDFIGLEEGDIVLSGVDLAQVSLDLALRLVGDTGAILTVFYGSGTDPDAAQELASAAAAGRPDLEVEVHRGGQPLYFYIMSAE